MNPFERLKVPIPKRSQHGEINYNLIDRFTLVHFALGAAYFLLGFSFPVVLILSITWEILENPLKVYFPFLFPHATADSWKNSFADTLAVCAGWLLVKYIFETGIPW